MVEGVVPIIVIIGITVMIQLVLQFVEARLPHMLLPIHFDGRHLFGLLS